MHICYYYYNDDDKGEERTAISIEKKNSSSLYPKTFNRVYHSYTIYIISHNTPKLIGSGKGLLYTASGRASGAGRWLAHKSRCFKSIGLQYLNTNVDETNSAKIIILWLIQQHHHYDGLTCKSAWAICISQPRDRVVGRV